MGKLVDYKLYMLCPKPARHLKIESDRGLTRKAKYLAPFTKTFTFIGGTVNTLLNIKLILWPTTSECISN